MRHLRQHPGKLALALLALACVALAGINVEGQSELTSTPATLTIADGGEDSKAVVVPVRAVSCVGNPTLYVAPLSGTSSGATATVRVELYQGANWIGTAYVGTVTMSTTSTAGAFLSDDVVIATSCRGATSVDVKVLDVSAGSVSLKRWVGAAASQ